MGCLGLGWSRLGELGGEVREAIEVVREHRTGGIKTELLEEPADGMVNVDLLSD